MQDSQANCGPFALKNALAAVGMARSAEELEALCGTTATAGTPVKNLIRAAGTIEGLSPRNISESRPEVALLMLVAALREGRPAVLCVDDWSHYVAAIGCLGHRVLIADAADNDLVVSLGLPEVIARWGRAGAKRPYWGLVL